MPILSDFKGVMKTLLWEMKEELNAMDHKLLRIAAGVVTFLVAASFWYIIFNGSSLF